MIIVFFFLGIFATVIGAAPPGASNLAVIKTTVQENIQESLKISYGAGLGEMILAALALSFGMMLQDFFIMNLWIQFLVIAILGIVGLYFLAKKKAEAKNPKQLGSKYMTGFALSVINPPVLVYWILVFSLLRNSIGFESNTATLLLFFTGIFLGKVLTLYGYGKLGVHLQNKKANFKTFVNKIIGFVLVSLSLLQGVKLLLF